MKAVENMTIGELVRAYPRSARILMSFGMSCIGCPSAQAETLKEASMVHGIDITQLLEELNRVL